MANSKPSQAENLLRLIQKEQIVFFHNEHSEPYASIQVNNHTEIWRMDSGHFKSWAQRLYWQRLGEAISDDQFKSALGVMSARARFDGDQIALKNRVAWEGGNILYDLCNNEWQAVKITKEGWEVIDNPPILFERRSHQQLQVTPTRDGSFDGLLPFLNMNDDQKKLLIVFIISTFIADFPHPVLNLFGGQGTSKSTLSKMLIRITDPSKPPLLRMRGDGKELVQQLAHRWFPFYDNLTEISNGISNALCSAVTGDGESRRKLYTDQDDVILHYQPVIGLNGINLIPKRSDLLERSLLIHLKPIPKNLRKAEKEVWESFEQILPEILGTIFDVLSTALRLRESIILKSKPRMADFAEWGSAIALGMGWAEQDFLQLYEENVKLQYLEAVDADPAALAVSVIMLNREVWQGSPTDLLKEMRLVAEQEKIDTNHRHWPKAANKLKSRLNEAEASLASQGIIIEHDDASHGQRTFRLKKITISIAPIARKPEEQLVEDKKQETLEVQTEERPSYTEKVNKDLAAMKKQRSGGTGGTSPHTSSTSDANHV